jgi:hypothetical protein
MEETYKKPDNYYIDDEFDDEVENKISNEEYNENISNEFYEETINIIQENLLNYVNDKSLPLCEYLNCEDIEKFINKYI